METVSESDRKITSSDGLFGFRSYACSITQIQEQKAIKGIFIALERRVARERGIHSHVSGFATIREIPSLTVGRPRIVGVL